MCTASNFFRRRLFRSSTQLFALRPITVSDTPAVSTCNRPKPIISSLRLSPNRGRNVCSNHANDSSNQSFALPPNVSAPPQTCATPFASHSQTPKGERLPIRGRNFIRKRSDQGPLGITQVCRVGFANGEVHTETIPILEKQCKSICLKPLNCHASSNVRPVQNATIRQTLLANCPFLHRRPPGLHYTHRVVEAERFVVEDGSRCE